jgi:hypothetical protein
LKVIVADIYEFYVHNSKDTKFPKEYSKYKIIWNLRSVLLELWEGKITELVLPELGTPGYDFVDFISKMIEIGQIEKTPVIKYYRLDIIKKRN